MTNLVAANEPQILSGLELCSIVRRMEKLLDRDRFLHSLGTYHTMLQLSHVYGGNIRRAAIMGLMHDCARGLTPSQIRRKIKEMASPLSKEDQNFPPIWHARLGALMVKAEFGNSGGDMAEGIRVHPTGAARMTRLAKMLFIADYMEPTRHFQGVERYRNLAFSNMEAAFQAVLKEKIEHVRRKGKPIHPDSFRALQCYVKEEEKRPS